MIMEDTQMIICSKCGERLPDDLKFCTSCGTGTATATKVVEAAAEAVSEPAPAPQAEPVIQAPAVTGTDANYQSGNTYTGAGQNQNQSSDGRMNFGLAIKNFITKIVDFTGTAGKKEYWFGALFFLIVMIAGIVVDYIPFVKYAAFLVRAAACLAFVSSTVRRIRDLGMPWTRIFFYLIPVYGQIRHFVELTK